MFVEPAIVKPVSLQNIILPGSVIFEEITEVPEIVDGEVEVVAVEEIRRTDCEVGSLTHSSMIFEEITEVVVRGRRTGEVSARETLDIHRKCLRLHWERGSCWNLP